MVSPDPPRHGAPQQETTTLNHDDDTKLDPSASELRDLQACLGLLERVWPRPSRDHEPVGRPDQLGRFRILGELGRGGFGIVFLAEDPILERKVAVKVPRVEVLSHSESWTRFLHEAKAASRLDHPNLVPLLETGEIGPARYIASVYVDGPSLDVWLARRGEPVPPRFAAQLVMVLARAIDHVHERGILHLDLKPGNVLLQDAASDGEAPAEIDPSGRSALPFVPRICDFGLARLLDAEGDDSRTVIAAGSPSYMAPEQAEGRKHQFTRATDVYGLGAILYELLTGRPPFRGKSSLDTIRKVVVDDPQPPRQLRPNLPLDLVTICLECLAKPPHRRYASAGALADDLESFLGNRPIQARPASIWDRAWKWSRRRPAAAVFVVFAVVGLAGGLVAMNRYNATLAAKNRELGDALVQAKRSEESAVAQKNLADARERRSRHLTAVSQVRQAQQAVEARQLELADQLLDNAAPMLGPAGERGFAWEYLSRRVSDELRVLKGHRASVEKLAVSPDGRTLASADGLGEIRLWDLATGECRVFTPRAPGGVFDLTFSPDGKTLAVSALIGPGDVVLWDVATGVRKGRLSGPSAHCFRVWFSADGARLFAFQYVTVNHPHRLLVWDVKSGDVPAAVDHTPSDSRLQAVVDLLEGKPIAPEANLDDSEAAFRQPAALGHAFTSDGRYAVFGQCDGTFEVVTVDRNFRVAIGRMQGRKVRELTFFSDRDARLNRQVDHITETLDPIKAALGIVVRRTSVVEPNHSANFGPGGRLAFLSEGSRIGPFLFEADGRRELAAYQFGASAQITTMTHLPDGATLAFGAVDYKIRLWRWIRPPDPQPPLVGHAPKEAWAVAYSPDGRLLATSGDDHQIRLWDPDSGEQRGELSGHPNLVSTIAWSPDGDTLASGGFDKKVRLWDVRAGRSRAVLSGHTGYVRVLAFSPDGRLLASLSDDRSIRLWNPREGRSVGVLSGPSGLTSTLAVSPNGSTLAAATLDGSIVFWDVATLQPRLFAAGPSPYDPASWKNRDFPVSLYVRGLAFSPDGATLAATYNGESAKLWDVASGEPRTTILGHNGDIESIAFAPDGRSLATGGVDHTVRVWDVVEGSELLRLSGHQARVRGVAFSPDGRTLASVDHAGAIRLWHASRP
jgi:eukaryotic-like serine/threonine-protein kinase